MTLSIELGAVEIVQAVEWEGLTIRRPIGEPPEFSVNVITFTQGEELMTSAALTLFSFPDNFLQCIVRRVETDQILFSGLARVRGGTKPVGGTVKWRVTAIGWRFMAALRKVGVPAGDTYIVQEDDDPDREPVAVFVDFNATKSPTPGAIKALFDAYWGFPVIDTETYVFDLLPVGAALEEMTFSGTDIEGVMGQLVAAANAAGLWWIDDTSPDEQSTTAPHLALRTAVIALPEDGDDGSDLIAAFPSAEAPIQVAPYEIDNDNPEADPAPGGKIQAMETTFNVDLRARRGAGYVRGRTGYTAVLEDNPAVPGTHIVGVGGVVPGGSGWVGSPGSIWGEDYIDAPAAISSDQRDAVGAAYLASKSAAQITGTVKIGGDHHGWLEGQALRVTDRDWGFAGKWFLVHEVLMSEPTSDDGDMEYSLSVSTVLSPALGYELREQVLREEREPLEPATRFIPYTFDLQIDPGGSVAVTEQLATDSGKAVPGKGVSATWFLKVNGVEVADPFDTGAAWYLSNNTVLTDEAGQITATLHAGAGALASDAAQPHAKIAVAA